MSGSKFLKECLREDTKDWESIFYDKTEGLSCITADCIQLLKIKQS